jgi:Peptidase family C54
VSLFHDDPGACLSIHSICEAGKKYGLVPGRWMGPYALCRAVADVASSHLQNTVRIVTIDSGGGAPCLDAVKCDSKQYCSHLLVPTLGIACHSSNVCPPSSTRKRLHLCLEALRWWHNLRQVQIAC